MIKTVIICANSEEAQALNEYLSSSRKTLVACEKMNYTVEIAAVRESWKASISGLYPILICTDLVLIALNITDVDWLIHYSIAVPSKTQFYFRFSMLMDNLRTVRSNGEVLSFNFPITFCCDFSYLYTIRALIFNGSILDLDCVQSIETGLPIRTSCYA